MDDGVEKKTYSAKQVASRIGTDAKQLRKFLRDPNSGYTPVGQGGRYDFPEEHLTQIKQAFDAWDATKVRRNRTRTTAAQSTPLIPGQRKESPGTETTPRSRRAPRPEQLFKQGLHGNGLDQDTFSERTQGIAARVKRHDLMPNQQGRLVEMPEHIRRAKEAAEIHNPYPDLETIPGLNKPAPVELDFRDPEELDKEAELEGLYSSIFENDDDLELVEDED